MFNASTVNEQRSPLHVVSWPFVERWPLPVERLGLLVGSHIAALDPSSDEVVTAGNGSGEADDDVVAKLDGLAGDGAERAVVGDADLAPVGPHDAVLGAAVVAEV